MSDELRQMLRQGIGSTHPVHAFDLFPELSTELDKRIEHATLRLKYWVLAGIMVNLLVAICGIIPIVFYAGQISTDIKAAARVSESNAKILEARAVWMNDRMVWEAQVTAALRERGVTTPIQSQAPQQETNR